MGKKLLLLVVFLSFTSIYAQEKEEGLTFQFSYQGDLAGNVCGGLKTGGTYLGYAQFGCSVDFEQLGWWKGGEFFVGGGNTHGGEPSATFLGDHQVADNIEAGNHTFLQELWIKQKFGFFTMTLGLQDYNSDFAVCEPAALFFNSSFGVHSALSSNMDLPIFPITSCAANFRFDIGQHHTIRAAFFDTPLDFDENPYNVKWQFNKEKGGLATAEYEFRSQICDSLEGTYTIGTNYQTAKNKWGFHLSASQEVWKNPRHSLAVFLMGSIYPKEGDNNHLHLGGGVTMTGVFSKKMNDCLGIGVTSALMAGSKANETTVELTYRYQVHKYISLQPDIQYIIHPSGETADLKNALFMALRLEIAL